MNGKIIEDDHRIHRILAEKVSVNEPPAALNDVSDEIRSKPEYLRKGEVTVVRLDRFSPEYQKGWRFELKLIPPSFERLAIKPEEKARCRVPARSHRV